MNANREHSNELNQPIEHDARANDVKKMLQKHSLDKNSNCEVIVMDSPNKTDIAYVLCRFLVRSEMNL